MPYVFYPPDVKVIAVRMTLEGKSRNIIRQALGFQISNQSFNRWRDLYEQTRRVIRNPEEYERLGRPRTLSTDDCAFMLQLVRNKPGLFLDEIREKLYDATGTLLSVESVHENLVHNLSITLKKAETLNSRKCLLKKYRYVAQMSFYPANYLVFTGELFLYL
jgi:transposase